VTEASPWLTDDELAEFTGYHWRAKQQLALAAMKVPFVVNPRGRILVRHDQIGAPAATAPRAKAPAGPNWSALRKPGKAA
jgi:hypothetical protein